MSYTYEPAPSQRWEALIRTAVEGEIVAHEHEQQVSDETATGDDCIARAATEAERHAARLLCAQARFGALHAETEASLKRKPRTGTAVRPEDQHGGGRHDLVAQVAKDRGAPDHGTRLDIRF